MHEVTKLLIGIMLIQVGIIAAAFLLGWVSNDLYNHHIQEDPVAEAVYFIPEQIRTFDDDGVVEFRWVQKEVIE